MNEEEKNSLIALDFLILLNREMDWLEDHGTLEKMANVRSFYSKLHYNLIYKSKNKSQKSYKINKLQNSITKEDQHSLIVLDFLILLCKDLDQLDKNGNFKKAENMRVLYNDLHSIIFLGKL